MNQLGIYSSVFLVYLLFAYSCESHQRSPTLKRPNQSHLIDTTIYKFLNFKTIDSASMVSSIDDKITKLSLLPENYKTAQSGSIKKMTSTVIRGVSKKPELCFSAKYCYKINSIDSLLLSIHKIHYAKLTPNKEIDDQMSLTLSLEEIIFYSDQDAQALLDYIRYVRSIEFFWNTIDKTPSDLFRRDNKLYFIKIHNNLKNRAVIKSISRKLKE